MTGYLTAALALVAGAVVLFRAQTQADQAMYERRSDADLALHRVVSAPAAHLVLPQDPSLVPLRRPTA